MLAEGYTILNRKDNAMGLWTKLFQKQRVHLPKVFKAPKYNVTISYPENWQVLKTSGHSADWNYVAQFAEPRDQAAGAMECPY